MSQFPHDDFVKEYLPELISNYGLVNSGKKIASQTKEIDVFFQPDNKVNNNSNQLGLLARLLRTTCLFEVYRNSVTVNQINECIGKLVDLTTLLGRESKKSKNQIEAVNLWILTPTLSQKILNSFEARTQEDWEEGIYFLPSALSTGIIVVHQLPVNKDTLWLRMLGKGKVQELAIEELNALPKDNQYRDSVLELVSNLFTMLQLNQQKKQELTSEDRQLVMKLSPIYTARLNEVRQQEATLLIVRQLKRKIGELSPNLEARVISLQIDILENLGEALLDFNSIDHLINWLNENDKGLK